MLDDGVPLKIFISYRRSDTSGQARLLHKELVARFGAENVFIDVDVEPGTNFMKVINERVADPGVLIALIGPMWWTILDERAKQGHLDVVKAEIEAALRRGSRVRVVPVLVDDARMPSADRLRRPLKPLAEIQAAGLRHTRWDDDMKRLVERIERVGLEIGEALEEERRPSPTPGSAPSPQEERPSLRKVAPPPDQGHYQDLVRQILDEGAVVPILGSGVNAVDRETWEDGSGYLPDADELAAHLTQRFKFTSEPMDLARVAQYVFVTKGKVDLYKTLRRILGADCAPSSVHRFLAGLPGTLQELGLPERYQLIVTTNYDDALERAFDEAQEPYDLAVYIASGEHSEKFLHIPFDGEPGPIHRPNEYGEFPIDDYGELERTVIWKINGAVDSARAPYPWKENYVITENDYIDYLSRDKIESLVPLQILNKMRESHFLFLGYRMRDWSLRVLLRRIFFPQQRLGAESWAIQQDPDLVEKEFWDDFGVDVFAAPLADYVNELGEHLRALENARAGP